MLRLILLAAIGLCNSPLIAKEPQVLAYYYPWYIAGDWSRHDYAGTPKLGKYGTDSPTVAARHVAWCADHDVDGLFVSWWGADHLSDQHLRKGLLKASNLDRTRFAIFYESFAELDAADGARDHVVDFGKPKVFEKLVADFEYLAKNYLSHPRYFKIAGRPLVGFYVTRAFKGFSRDHLRRLRKAIGVDLYCMADEAFFGAQKSPATSRHRGDVFDAYTAYNMFENAKVRSDDTALSYQQREAFPIFRTWADKTTFFPGVFPSYADFRGNKKLPGKPAEFAKLLRHAHTIADRNATGAPRIILVTSFNEWWEGTTIEPAKEYQRSYLEVIRDFKRRESKTNQKAKKAPEK